MQEVHRHGWVRIVLPDFFLNLKVPTLNKLQFPWGYRTGPHYSQRKLPNIQSCHLPDITQMSNSTLVQTIIPIYNSVTWQLNWHQSPHSQKSAYSLNQSSTHVIPKCLPLNNAVLSCAGQLEKKSSTYKWTRVMQTHVSKGQLYLLSRNCSANSESSLQ